MKNNNNKLIPKLRFPDFYDSWKIFTVEDFCDVFRGSPFAKLDISKRGANACIHYGELFTKYNEVISCLYSKTNRADGLRSKIGDILMPSSDVTSDGLAKASVILIDDVILGGDMNVLRPKNEINSIYLSYLLNHSKKNILKLVSGTTIKHLYPSQIITLSLTITDNKQEQQKIADCLSSLDDLIEAHCKKLELLKQHKKGLLQNLFPQEGEKVPKLRFPEFENCGEWEKVALMIVCKYKNGKAHENNIDEEGKYIVVNSKFISSEGEIVKFSNLAFCLAQKGDILMVLSDVPNGKAIAKCFYVKEDNKFTVNQRICRITSKNINSVLLFYLLNRNPYFLRFDDRVKQTNLKKEDVLNCPIFIPKESKEQKKIADCLLSLDALIERQIEKIEQLKQHKKGLMQGLFPKID